MMKPMTVIYFVVLTLLFSACSPSPETANTQTTETQVAVATQTSIATTPTTIVVPVPKPGHWAGSTFEFDVTPDRHIKNLSTGDSSNFSICKIKVDEIVIQQDNTFVFSQLDPLTNVAEKEKEFIKANSKVTIVQTDKGEEFEVLRITGKFDSSTSLSGDINLLSCLHNIYANGMKTTWNAEWKNP